MGESTREVEWNIAAERNALGRNLHALEDKAMALTDWRTHYRRHPWALLGMALGGGLLLGAVTAGRGRDGLDEWAEGGGSATRGSASPLASQFSTAGAQLRRRIGDTAAQFADVLLGVATTRAVQFVSDKVPGFREEFAAQHPQYRVHRQD